MEEKMRGRKGAAGSQSVSAVKERELPAVVNDIKVGRQWAAGRSSRAGLEGASLVSVHVNKHGKSAPVYLAAVAEARLGWVSLLRPWRPEQVMGPLRYGALICGPEIL